MAGFTMPKRGSGAAMLRDLREDERPPLEEMTFDEALAELQEEPVSPTEINVSSQSYDNMTNHMTDKQTEQKAEKQSGRQTRKKTSKSVSQNESQSVGQVAGHSVAEMIRQRAAQRGEQEVLKTVTLKLSPTLDEKVERYCFENKMKKQEFWAEAAALYFEMIAEGESL